MSARVPVFNANTVVCADSYANDVRGVDCCCGVVGVYEFALNIRRIFFDCHADYFAIAVPKMGSTGYPQAEFLAVGGCG